MCNINNITSVTLYTLQNNISLYRFRTTFEHILKSAPKHGGKSSCDGNSSNIHGALSVSYLVKITAVSFIV